MPSPRKSSAPDPRLARAADANANRAREGLRVLEDLLRFVFGAAGRALEAKRVRHGVSRAVERAGWNVRELLASRDSQGDPGRAGRYEVRKPLGGAPGAVALRNLHRAQEALRVLEELAPAAAAQTAFKRLRFRLYRLEKLLGADGILR